MKSKIKKMKFIMQYFLIIFFKIAYSGLLTHICNKFF